MLTIKCVHCRHVLAYDERHAGKTTKCPKCGERVLLSGPTGFPIASDVGERGAAPTENEIIGQEFGPNEDKRHLKILGILCAALLCLGLVVTLIYWVTRDTWEQECKQRVMAKLGQAERTQETDALTAFQVYDEVLRESASHKVKDIDLRVKLDAAKTARDRLKKLLDERQQIETRKEADRKREEEAMQAAQRKAQEKEKEEKEALRALVSKWRNVPKAGRDAYNSVKRIQARIEIGVNQAQYAEVVGQAWAEVKGFVDSPEGKEFGELSYVLLMVMEEYKSAAKFYHEETIVQSSWHAASVILQDADELMSTDLNEKVLAQRVSCIRSQMESKAKRESSRRERVNATESE